MQFAVVQYISALKHKEGFGALDYPPDICWWPAITLTPNEDPDAGGDWTYPGAKGPLCGQNGQWQHRKKGPL